MKKYIKYYFILLALFLFSLVSCNKSSSADVVVSFYALNELTTNLTKDTNITVDTLIKGTAEPHEFEPSPSDVSKLYSAKTIIFNGLGLEEFSSALDNSIKNKIIYATDSMKNIIEGDPHAFISPKRLTKMLTYIKDNLVNTFKDEETIINKNYEAYLEELNELDTLYKEAISSQVKPIVVSHEAFNYLKEDYNLNYYAVSGISEEEPTAKDISRIINLIKDNEIKVVYGSFFESDKTLSQIANETNSSLEYLYTLEMMDSSNVSLVDAIKYNAKVLVKNAK